MSEIKAYFVAQNPTKETSPTYFSMHEAYVVVVDADNIFNLSDNPVGKREPTNKRLISVQELYDFYIKSHSEDTEDTLLDEY